MMNTIHAAMHAIGQDTYGSPEVLKEIELPRPEPGLSEILVAVRAAGVNPTDWKNRAQVATIERIQHNPLAPDGPEAMKAFGAAWHQQYPDAAYDIKRAVTEGDWVLLHSHALTVPGTPGLAVFDIFRFQDGKIAEHWDVLQEVPAATGDSSDVFSTLSHPQT
jgi:predicted SnoaL-like aldol condensation-catalyzing enzyme